MRRPIRYKRFKLPSSMPVPRWGQAPRKVAFPNPSTRNPPQRASQSSARTTSAKTISSKRLDSVCSTALSLNTWAAPGNRRLVSMKLRPAGLFRPYWNSSLTPICLG